MIGLVGKVYYHDSECEDGLVVDETQGCVVEVAAARMQTSREWRVSGAVL